MCIGYAMDNIVYTLLHNIFSVTAFKFDMLRAPGGYLQGFAEFQYLIF